MARLFGYLAAPGTALPSAKTSVWRQQLQSVSAGARPVKMGAWTSPGKNAAVIYAESAASPFRSHFDENTNRLYILEGTAWHDQKILTAAEIAARHLSQGDLFANDLQGGFCVLMIDPAHQKLVMLKDRFGPKPMFYTVHQGIFYFSSYASMLAGVATGHRGWNPDIVIQYAASHYSVTFGHPQTFFKNVLQLLPATVLQWDGKEIRTSEYWRLDKKAPFLENETEGNLKTRFAELLHAAVLKRTATLSNHAVSLSGGMDSNTVLGYLNKISGEKQTAISVTYGEQDRANERDLIEPVLNRYVKKWHNVVPTFSEFKNDVLTIYKTYDQPWTTATVYAQKRLMQKAGELNVSTLVTGSGGDHLMAGAYPHFLYYFAYLRQTGQEPLLKHEVERWIHYHSVPPWLKTFQTVETFFKDNIDFEHPGTILQPWVELCPQFPILSPDYRARYTMPSPVESYGDYPRTYIIQELHRAAFQPALWAEDIMGWHYGVSGCDPLLDRELFEYSWMIPHRYKIRDGINKYLMREATEGIVSDHLRARAAKTGFNLPFDVWLREGLAELVGDILHSQAFKSRGIFNTANVDRVWDAHQRGEMQQGMLLWQLLNLEMWFRAWIDNN